MSEEIIIALEFGLVSAIFALGTLLYVRKQKAQMRKSVLRYERIKDKLED